VLIIKDEVNILEEKEVMSFKDENGNKVDFEAIAKVYLGEQGYLLLSPVDDNSNDMFAFRIDINEEGNEELNLVEDDKEFEEIKKEYKKLLY
jgi:uncharacterized protein YrzB (UPF0473 family)